MATTKLVRGMEWRHPSNSTVKLIHNIPIVYYCVCSSAAATVNKSARWYGILKNNGNSINVSALPGDGEDKFRLYQGVAVAVLFVNGCDVSVTPTLNIDNTGDKPIVLNDSDNFSNCVAGEVVVFIYDGKKYKVSNGINSGVIKELKDSMPTTISVEREQPNNRYKYNIKIKNADGEEISSSTLDLPLEYLISHVEAATEGGKQGLKFYFKAEDPAYQNPVFVALDSITDGFVKDNASAHTEGTAPVYVDNNGIIQSFDMSDYSKNWYHSGSITPVASNATSGLVGTWISNGGAPDQKIIIPIYWGTAEPTMSAVKGAIYIKI